MHCEWVVFKIKRTCSLLQRAVNSAILHRLVNNTGINSIENFCFLNSVGVHHHTVEFFCWEVLTFSWLPGVMLIPNCKVSKKLNISYKNILICLSGAQIAGLIIEKKRVEILVTYSLAASFWLVAEIMMLFVNSFWIL